MSIKSSNRTLVNALGIPGILALLWVGGPFFGIFIGVVVLLAIREFLSMTKVDNSSLLNWIAYAGGIGFCIYFYFLPDLSMIQFMFILGPVIILGFILEMAKSTSNPTGNLAMTFFSVLYIGGLLGSLIGIRNYDTIHSSFFTLSMVLSIWVCDSAAFYFGSKWGQKKILPKISPNKSWVGCIAGLCSSFVVYGLATQLNVLSITTMDMVLLSIISGIFGQAGDFAESLLKRHAGVKDSGALLLGHGGVLDRFDSLIFASPLTFCYLYCLQNSF